MSDRREKRDLLRRRKKLVAQSPAMLTEAVALFPWFKKMEKAKEPLDYNKRVNRVRNFFKKLHAFEVRLAKLYDEQKGIVDSRRILANTYGEEFSNFVFHDYSLDADKQRQLHREGDTKPKPANTKE